MRILSITAILLLLTTFSQQTTTIIPELDCSQPIDIYFALDASDSLSEAQFELEKELVSQLLQRLIDGNRDAQAGFLTFTEAINNQQNFESNLAIVQFTLGRVIFDREGTSLRAPITYVYDNIFTPSNSLLREDSRKLFFLITDGEDETSTLVELSDSARLLEERNVTIVTMGIGTLTNTVQLSQIASQPHEQNLLLFSDLNEALANVSSIIDRTCTIPVVIIDSVEVTSSRSVTIRWIPYSFTQVLSYRICLTVDMRECNITFHDINSTLTEFMIDTLVPNTLYSIYVFADTDLGFTPSSAIIQAMTAEAPGIPINLSYAAVTSNSITVTWQMASSGASQMYELCFSLSSGGSCAEESMVDGSIQPLEYLQDNLRANTTYYIRIRGVNPGESGNYSAEITATTEMSTGPELLSVTTFSFHIIIVTWSAYGNGAVNSYEVCVKLEGTSACVQNVTVSSTITTATLFGLGAYTSYEVSLVAITALGRSETSNSITVRTGETSPSAPPASTSAIALSATEIGISWTEPPVNQHNGIIVEYFICVRKSGDESCLYELTHNATETPFRVTLSGLEAQTDYSVRVRAINGGGSGPYSNDLQVTTGSLEGVTIDSVNTISPNSLVVSWVGGNVPSSEITGAVIYLTSSTGVVQSVVLSQTAARSGSFLVEQLNAGTNYSITVVVNTTIGETPVSDAFDIRTPESTPGQPGSINVVVLSADGIQISWTEVPSENQNGIIIDYTVCIREINSATCQPTNTISPSEFFNIINTGLIPNTSYTVVIQARTSVGLGVPIQANITTESLQAVRLFVQTYSEVSNKLTWTAPNVQSSSITGGILSISNSPNGAASTFSISQADAISGEIIVDGLSPATTQYYTLRIETDLGTTPESNQVSASTAEGEPSGSPTNFSAEAISDRSVRLTWGPVDPGLTNGVVISYTICYGTSINSCSEIEVNATQLEYTFINLEPETTYYFNITASTAVGTGPSAGPISQTTSLPGGLNITNIEAASSSSVNVTWDNLNIAVTRYEIIVRTDGLPDQVIIVTDPTDVPTTSYTITDLEAYTLYYVTVRAVTPEGNIDSLEESVRTDEDFPASAVTNLTATAVNSSTIVVSWNEVVEKDRNGIITEYFVCVQATTGGACLFTETVFPPSTQVSISGLTTETKYSVVVRASTSMGAGPNSTPVLVTTLPPTPGEPDVEVVVENGPYVTINGNFSDTGGPISDVTVCVRLTGEEECVNISIIDDGTSFSGDTDELEPNTEYEVVVIIVGPGGVFEVDPIVIRTLPEAPEGSVENIESTTTTTNIYLNWTQPALPNHDNLTYYVTVRLGGVVVYTIETTDTEVSFSGLDPNTIYNITIIPSNAVGNGTSSTISVSTEQEQPEPLEVVLVNGTSVQVTITPTGSTSTSIPINHYEVCVQSTSDYCDRKIIVQANENLTFIIDDLSPNVLYYFTVVSHVSDHTGIGTFTVSPQSDPVTAMIPTTDPPTGTVTNLQVEITDFSNLNVSWSFNATSQESAATHFYVCLALTLNGECTITREVTTDITSVEITEAERNTLYFIMVYPKNINGLGPVSQVSIITPDIPPPFIFTLGTSLSPFEILFEWETNNILLNISSYTICLYIDGMPECNQTADKQLLNSGEIVFSGLIPDTNYTVSILELEPETDEATVSVTTLLERISDSPLNVQVSVFSSTILRVTWVASEDTLSMNLTAWKVCFEAERFDKTSGCVLSDTDELYSTILNLEEYEYYYITVRGVYSNGTGTEFSVPVRGRTEQDVPSESISELRDFEEGSMPTYTWKAPTLIEQNGIIVYYLVVFEYEEEGIMKSISFRENPITNEIVIPSLVTTPYNISVVPYTIGAGPSYKLIGSVVEPFRVPSPCPDTRIVITVLCVVLAVFLVLAIVMCCIILILIVKKRSAVYSTI